MVSYKTRGLIHAPLGLLAYHLASLSRSSRPGVFNCQLKKKGVIFLVSDLNLYSYMKGQKRGKMVKW